MKHAVVEKRIAGIIRWLERLNKSYSTGEMESALMEAECARADLETLRRDVWAKIQPEDLKRSRFMPGFMAVLRPAFLAVVMVMSYVGTLAKDNTVNVMPVLIEQPVIQAAHIEPVIAEPVAEVKPVEIVQTQKTEAPVIAAKTETPKKQQPRKVAVKKPSVAAAGSKTSETVSKTVAYDKVFSLMQTGQRALRNNTSVIKVQ